MTSRLAPIAAVSRPVGSLLVGVEALALIAGAIAYAVVGATGSGDAGLTWSLVAMCALLAVPLGFAAVAVARGHRWGRSYALMWQVLQVAAGVYLIEVSPVLGLAAVAVALVAGAAVLADTRRDPRF